MAQMVGTDEIESLRIELAQIGRSIRSSFRRENSSHRSNSLSSLQDEAGDDEHALLWAAIDRLPTFERLRSSLFDEKENDDNEKEDKADAKGKRVIDVTKLGAVERRLLIEKLIKHIEHDNLRLLKKIRKRIDKAGVQLPTIEVRYKNLCVEAECEVVRGKPLPTLWNTAKSWLSDLGKLSVIKSNKATISIMNDVSGIIEPGRITLLLGSPGGGKTSLLKALSGNLDQSLKLTGEVSYNGYKLEEFVPQKTSAYISQHDVHIPEMTVREILDFSARCQGVGSRAEIMLEVSRKEKEAGTIPDPDIDTYMKAVAVQGLKRTLQTDYILKILGLDICADTIVGDAMRRGISGGQRKRLTTAEMIVGPTKALFMDEITNGLDSSTAFQTVACLQQLAHITDATILVSLLQPAPETFDLFDDLILMSEGKIFYHGPRDQVLEFFQDCGFRCPPRKGVADFLQEVISKKDQAQFWHHSELPYSYVSVDMFSRKFKASSIGKKLEAKLSVPFDNSRSHKNALSFSVYSLSKWELLKACASREFLLMKRNYFTYVFKTTQLFIIAFIAMTVFLRTRMKVDVLHANYYMGAQFYSLVVLLVDSMPELSMTIQRLQVFYKQKELCFYPAWAYCIPAAVLKIPLSFVESLVWTSLTYYVIGYSPEFKRFLRHFMILFALHLSSISMFRFVASIFRSMVGSMVAGGFSVFTVLVFAGFIISRSSMPVWLKWGFWVSPVTHGELGISLNEFLAPRWQKMLPTNTTIGRQTLESRGLNYDGYVYWISLGALFGYIILFNIGYTVALSFFNSSGSSRAIISDKKLSEIQGTKESSKADDVNTASGNSHTNDKAEHEEGRMVLPFTPLTVVFEDLQYYVDTPVEMRERGFTQNKLQLLSDITGALKPSVLTALMGVSGAGKTTLLDVLAGRKTTGYIEGEIKIGGYAKVQETFARVSGYCEQSDIHSPQITVEESITFSAWLRLDAQIDSKTKAKFVDQVLETIELDGIKDALVGIPGVNGLSTEQRKRLTIAVELVSNPSIIFMDEPTTGLDARAAAIVMRAVKNVAETGRTIVCTIHQPSIDIFETFDELILLKTGGRMIYSGPLGLHSSRVIEYFEAIPRVPKIRSNYNPATWMMEITSTSSEAEIGVNFDQLYKESNLYENSKEVVKQLGSPQAGSKDLSFPTRFSQNGWFQFKSCLWKHNLSYWRSPSYNLRRLMHVFVTSLILGVLFWDQGQKMDNQQNLFNAFGSMYISILFLGINNCNSVLSYVATERPVMYRERFAGMYSSWAYSAAQVAVEVPYVFIQTVIFVIITYPMIGYDNSAYKVFWYFYAMFFTLMYYTYLGMMLVSLTPNYMIAAILSSAYFTTFNLFAGFLIPKRQIPKWWIWLYYLTPTSWTANGLLTSQYGDVDKGIMVFGDTKNQTVAAFLEDYFSFHHDQLPLVAVMLIVFPLVFSVAFSYSIGQLNFQRR
ncbi:hypothetical protein L6164_034920 [Bauhinia variegata]|uniref:Uncharacterized protein n=1 Tax=Bauhinia variegata TaxID=167791 RepID=A0ACB9KWC5_BAUVA|nr:hypothetical protein L6164_034920 [Bauhinia variegata]